MATVQELLIHHNELINFRYRGERTLLEQAVLKDKPEIVSLLVGFGANVDIRDHTGMSLLMFAIENGRDEIAKILVNVSEETQVKSGYEYSAIMSAAGYGKTEIVRLLVKKDRWFSLYDTGAFGRTALMCAIEGGYIGIAMFLIHKGANINAMYIDGATMLTRAAERHDERMVEILIGLGANPLIADQHGVSVWTMLISDFSEMRDGLFF